MSAQSKEAKQRSEIARLTQARQADQSQIKRLRGLLAAVLRDRPGARREAEVELSWGANREWVD